MKQAPVCKTYGKEWDFNSKCETNWGFNVGHIIHWPTAIPDNVERRAWLTMMKWMMSQLQVFSNNSSQMAEALLPTEWCNITTNNMIYLDRETFFCKVNSTYQNTFGFAWLVWYTGERKIIVLHHRLCLVLIIIYHCISTKVSNANIQPL